MEQFDYFFSDPNEQIALQFYNFADTPLMANMSKVIVKRVKTNMFIYVPMSEEHTISFERI